MNFLLENWGLIFLALVSGALLLWPAVQRARAGAMLGSAAATRLINDGALIVDVRDPAEFAQGHLPNARNIPVADVDKRAADLPAGKPVIVMCASGPRSIKAAATLRKAGRDPVFCLEGGLAAWRSAGLPVVR